MRVSSSFKILSIESFRSLLGLSDDIEAMGKRRLFKEIWGKDSISTRLLDRERALRNAYDSLMVCDNNKIPHTWLIAQRRCGLLWTRTLLLG